MTTTTAPAPEPSSPSADRDPRWSAVIARDRQADGTFYYSVATTGVYCRPSCASRRANPKNVRFHATPADAEQAGFRPCRRCRPDQLPADRLRAAKVAEICRVIDAAPAMPRLSALAARAGLSPYHLHRVFKSVTGLTPRGYAAAQRARRVRQALSEPATTVTRAMYDAGFESSSRFYESADAMLGMTPSDYRRGGANTTIHFALGRCSLGSVLVAQTARGVCAVLLGDDDNALVRELQDRFRHATLVAADLTFDAVVAAVIACVDSPGASVDLPLDVHGTVFQQRVWDALRRIPVGETASYAEIAQRIGADGSARAVARACAANPLAVIIPCHRVVHSDGSLSGYRWGVRRKERLLEREKPR